MCRSRPIFDLILCWYWLGLIEYAGMQNVRQSSVNAIAHFAGMLVCAPTEKCGPISNNFTSANAINISS